MTRIRPAGWLARAAALFLLAVAGYALLVHALPQDYWKQTDATVYQAAGLAVRHQPAGLYTLRLGVAKQPFTYTPFAALLFAVASLLPFAGWQVVLAVLTIVLLPVVAYQALGIAGRPAGLARAAAATRPISWSRVNSELGPLLASPSPPTTSMLPDHEVGSGDPAATREDLSAFACTPIGVCLRYGLLQVAGGGRPRTSYVT